MDIRGGEPDAFRRSIGQSPATEQEARSWLVCMEQAVLDTRGPLAPVAGVIVFLALTPALVLCFADNASRRFAAWYLLSVSLAALLAGLVIKLRRAHRVHLGRIQADAERQAREHCLIGLGALTAGAAHEMRTPLTTMSVIVGELRESGDDPPRDWKKCIDVLWKQLQLCTGSLNAMAHAASVERLGGVEKVRAAQFVADVVERFGALRPGIALALSGERLDDALMLMSDHSLLQAVLNFLGNAADASPHSVELRAALNENACLAIEVLDRGPGIPPHVRGCIGKSLITRKEPGRGSGFGALIGHAAVERLGGTVCISDRHGGGTTVHIELPVFGASVEREHEYRGFQAA